MQPTKFPFRMSLLVGLIVLGAAPAIQAAPIPEGSSKIEVDVGSRKLDVFTYKPKNFKDGPLIVIFHGTNRNADEYRDFGKGLADRIGALVVAPLFDNKQFSSD